MKYIKTFENNYNIKHLMEILNKYDITIEDILTYDTMVKMIDIDPEIFKIYIKLSFYNDDFNRKLKENIERLKADDKYKYLFDSDDLGLL